MVKGGKGYNEKSKNHCKQILQEGDSKQCHTPAACGLNTKRFPAEEAGQKTHTSEAGKIVQGCLMEKELPKATGQRHRGASTQLRIGNKDLKPLTQGKLHKLIF